MDDSFFIRSPSLLSRANSRRSHTPSPHLNRSYSRSADMIDSLKRSISRKGATSSSPVETPNITLSKLMSHNHTNTTNVSGDLSRNTSRRSTTPIIFSQSKTRKKPHQVEKRLECSLEELCFGATKKVKIKRDVISDAGIIVQEEETLHINVKPSWRKGTTIIFEGKGDEKPGYLPADIIFLIDEKRHALFKRVGDDLELGVEISLLNALVGCSITLPLLGGKKMFLRVDDVMYPGYEKVIQDQGMPMSNECGKRGDLRLKFIVNFPNKLSDDKCIKICNILETCF
ncbi:dnaJ homolog subfamily B member 13-like [Chenopodium quinoa]|uniref:dnaJ homolog subfamily B member 13-like n=1 Tax=Chenopodium quinoa TaxID=63459 RepID=UPI000B793063|nr:dnaJ homolog subfamily B member 13-like [Chenopodium quinoa]